MAQAKTKTGAVEKKLVGVADTTITAAERSKDPTLTIPIRSLANVNFNEKRGVTADALAELQRATSPPRCARSTTAPSTR